jgi:hypothetical protein
VRQLLPRVAVVIAVASAFAGAVVALLPALVLAMVSLFYNSFGGVLIFLGSLLSLLPHPVMPGEGGSWLPVFPQLDADNTVILIRSVVATVLCFLASTAMVASWGKQDLPLWLRFGLLCLLAAIAGGGSVAWLVLPAIAISVGQCVRVGLGGRRGEKS